MRKTAAFVTAIGMWASWVGLIGAVGATIRQTGQAQPNTAIGQIDKHFLADQDKLGKSYSPEIRNRLAGIARQLLLDMPNLTSKTSPQQWAQGQVGSAFPSVSGDTKTGMVFWVMTEVTKGAQDDARELLSQKTLAEGRQRQAADLLARTRQRLASLKGVSAAKTKRSSALRQPPLTYTRNMRLAFHRVPDLQITVKDVDSASPLQLKALEKQLNSVGDDAQLANIDLQNALQQEQQLIGILSTVMKVDHDMAAAVIRNLN